MCQKKITAFGLLLLVAIPLFFSVGILVKQKIIQYQRSERLETELLQTITISSEKINWVKPGKEILVDGKLFDVKSFKTEEKKILLTGFFDSEEDNLIAKLKNELQQKKGDNSPLGQLVAKHLSQQVFSESVSFSIQTTWKILTINRFSFYSELMPEAHCFSIVPPPKLV